MCVYAFAWIKDRGASSVSPNASPKAEPLENTREARQGPVLRLRSQMQSHGFMATPVSIAICADGNQADMVASDGSVGDRPQGSGERNVRRKFIEVVLLDSSSLVGPRIPSLVQNPWGGTSRRQPVGGISQDGNPSSLSFSYDKDVPIFEDPTSMAAVWRKI